MLSLIKQRAAQSPNRERLKTAIAARDAEQQGLDAMRETLERLQGIIRISDDASRAASDAARKETEARNAWVREGCAYSAGRELQALTDASAEAARAAKSAALNADAVSKELSRIQSAIQSAQLDIQAREDDISAAIGLIIAEESAPLLERFEHLAEEYRALRAKVMGVRVTFAQPWGLDSRNKLNPRWEGERTIIDALLRAKIKDWEDERQAARDHEFVHGARDGNDVMLEEQTAHWRARAAALRQDPDA